MLKQLSQNKGISGPGAGLAPALSVLIPLGPRYEDLEMICAELRRVLKAQVESYEIIFVDDANGPGMRQRLKSVSGKFPETRIVHLRRHMGESIALTVAAQAARGAYLLTLDPYLHVAIEDLPKLLAPLEEGYDLVCAWRTQNKRQGLSWLAPFMFNAAARLCSGVPVHDLNCRTRAMRREAIQNIPIHGDLYRFLPIFAARRGLRWLEVKMPQQPGKHELGSLSPASYARRALDLLTLLFLTRFVKRPLHFFGLVGLSGFISGSGICLYLTFLKLIMGQSIGHRPLLLLGVLLLVMGIQIASIGLLGELLIFTHGRDVPDYTIEEVVE